MTLQGTINWGDHDRAAVDSDGSLRKLLMRLKNQARGHPFMINITAPDGRILVLGLGRERTVLSLNGPNGSLPYFASVGEEEAGEDISFDYYGEETYFNWRHTVPIHAARMAAIQFLRDPGLPNAISWEEI